MSVSSRESRDFAFLRLSASSVNVRYLCFTSPLLPFASCSFSMAAYSSRTSSKPSCCGGMAILFEKSPCPAMRFTKVSCKPTELLAQVQLEDALKHPNWSMGHKITIDSATLVNKGLEVMEAKWLFGVRLDQIQVVVHPQSIIHSMVEYVDGGIIAQLGTPDMKLPIQYALFYPDRRPMAGKRVDFYELGSITFEKPDMETFTGFKLAMRAAAEGGSMPTVFNAANERAVSLFLGRKIRFLQIPEMIELCMDAHHSIENPSVEEILRTEQETYELIRRRTE